MIYRFAPDGNYEDLAAGRVLYHRGGMPCFPVRLGYEIFCRCLHYRGKQTGVRLYDPCCGGAYLLTALGFLEGRAIGAIVGSDIDEQALALAGDNLSLLTPEGRLRRRAQLEELFARYRKPAHREAIESLDRLEQFAGRTGSPNIRTFRADILRPGALPDAPEGTADVILADVPYGKLTAWSEETGFENGESSLDRLFRNLAPVRGERTVTAVVSDKAQKFRESNIYRLDKFNIGKRKVEIFQG